MGQATFMSERLTIRIAAKPIKRLQAEVEREQGEPDTKQPVGSELATTNAKT